MKRQRSQIEEIRSNVTVKESDHIARYMFVCASTERLLGYSSNKNVIEFNAHGKVLFAGEQIKIN